VTQHNKTLEARLHSNHRPASGPPNPSTKLDETSMIVFLYFLFALPTASFTFTKQAFLPQQHSARSVLLHAVPTILDWTITKENEVNGYVVDHPSIPDYDKITTSSLSSASMRGLKERKVVKTNSGSKYKLGNPLTAPEPSATANMKGSDISTFLPINGKKIGLGKYLLVGSPKRSTSGKSQIWSCYRSKNGEPTGELLIAKISRNFEALEREDGNYKRVNGGLFGGELAERGGGLRKTSMRADPLLN